MIVWAPVPGNWQPWANPQRASAGEWAAVVWKSGTGCLPWRAKLRRNENDYRQVRCYRTEVAAKARMELFLRRATS